MRAAERLKAMMELRVSRSGWETDADLVTAGARGDTAAQRRIIERLFSRIRALSKYLVGNDAEADDIAQTAFIEILRSLKGFRGESSLEAWAQKIAFRTAMRRLKYHKRLTEVVVSKPDVDEAGGLDGDKVLDRRIVSRRLSELLDSMKPKHRSAVVLKLVFGYSIQEIADITDSRANTVRDRLQVGRRQLDELIRNDPVLRECRAGMEREE